MNKIQFLLSMSEKLSALPREEVEERLRFYSEMIEDRMEEGLTEEQAVAEVGSVEEIAKQILNEADLEETAAVVETVPAQKPEAAPKRKGSAWKTVLLIVGAPLWLPLVIAAWAVGIALYVAVWAVIISLWACFGALVGTAGYLLIAGAGFAISGNVAPGAAMVGGGMVCAGMAIFLFFGCKLCSKAAVWMLRLFFRIFRKKEAAK